MSIQDDIKADIAAERAKLENAEPVAFEIAVGGKKRKLAVTRVPPADWANLTVMHRPRPDTVDEGVGYNQETLPPAYPTSRITIDGETVDQDTWRDLYGALVSPHRERVGTAIWGVNVYAGIEEFRALGKATAGKPSSSPASKESPPVDSSAGNQPR